jgi:hypothetical protein
MARTAHRLPPTLTSGRPTLPSSNQRYRLLADAIPGAVVEAIVHRLLRGGGTDLEDTTPPLWIIGHGPSGCCFQVLWRQGQEAYCVSRWTPDEETTEGLGHFPDWEAAIDRALQA